MKSITQITLYELMAEDLDVWLKHNNEGIDLQIDGEYGKNLVTEERVHPAAIDSFAAFCRQYLSSYDRVTKEIEQC